MMKRSKRPEPSLRVAGVMTGTSCDGLDVACVEFSGAPDRPLWKPLWSGEAPFPAPLRRRVLAAQAERAPPGLRQWLLLHHDLGVWYARTLARILSSRAPRPLVIANHGQTVAHWPEQGLTLQLGDPSLLARATGLTVATSFREGDLAAGGQGAPLVPRFHQLLARRLGGPGRKIALHNLGGISNLSYFGGGELPSLAFDTGPGNLWIDAAAARVSRGRLTMDTDGRLALRGAVDAKAVASVLGLGYFRAPAPKSTGRGDFPFERLLARTRAKGADLVATATAVTAESIARAYRDEVVGRGLDAIYFCGGGAKNPALLGMIRRRLPGVEVRSLAEAGIDPQTVEAQAFALAGYRALLGLSMGGGWTGARGFAPPAHLVPGPGWLKLMTTVLDIRSRL